MAFLKPFSKVFIRTVEKISNLSFPPRKRVDSRDLLDCLRESCQNLFDFAILHGEQQVSVPNYLW